MNKRHVGRPRKQQSYVDNLTALENTILEYFYTKRPDLKNLLLKEQADMLNDLVDISIKTQVLSCGRGYGKTMLAGCTALYFIDEFAKQIKKELKVLVVSPQDELWTNIDKFFREDPTLGPRLLTPPSLITGREIPKKEIQLKDTHCTVTFCKPTTGQIRGNRADLIIIDESEEITEDMKDVITGCSKVDLIGKVIYIGTPYDDKGKQNWFVTMVQKLLDGIEDPKYEGYKLSRYPSEICKWNAVDRWRKDWSIARFKAECLGIPPSIEERSFYPHKCIDECVLDVEPLREGGTNSFTEFGIDLGIERSVLMVTEKIGVRRKVLDIIIWKNIPVEERVSDIKRLKDKYQPRYIKIDSKPLEEAQYIKLKFGSIVMLIDASKQELMENKWTTVKEIMMGQSQKLVRERKLLIPSQYIEFIEELKKYQRKMNRGDDIVDAFVLSIYEPIGGFKTFHAVVTFGTQMGNNRNRMFNPNRKWF
jgi:hypothetical protein